MLLTVLAGLMTIDYLTGLICIWAGEPKKNQGGGVSSKIGLDGLARKGFIVLIVLMATLLDKAIGTDNAVFQAVCAGFYVANEGTSIVKNAELIGLPIPPIIKTALEAFKNKGEGDTGSDAGDG